MADDPADQTPAPTGPDAWEELRESFEVFDKEKTGHISVYSADTAFRLAGIAFSEADNTHFLKSMGLEKEVTFHALRGYAESYGFRRCKDAVALQDDARELREAYYVLSKDNDGRFVSPAQLKRAMNAFGIALTDEEVEEMVAEADFDKDGKVNYKDFARIMTTL